jgi:hypothetical protein
MITSLEVSVGQAAGYVAVSLDDHDQPVRGILNSCSQSLQFFNKILDAYSVTNC